MNTKDLNFIGNLEAACKTHAEWLIFIRFGLKTLLENQLLLVGLIEREANREFQRQGGNEHTDHNQFAQMLDELGLQLTVGDAFNRND